MDLQTTRELNIDVSNHKYLSIDTKQYDRNLRYILITCYHQGSFLPINKNTCFASVRYRKPDNYGVFNTCEITQDGRILVELTEQMLAVAGLCYADVVIHENLNLAVNIVENADGSVEIIDTGNSGIISTMTFIINVREAAFDNEEVESSYEYNALNDLLTEARRNYDAVMESCNASEANAKTSEINAKTSETKAKTSETNAKTSEDNALISETKAKASEDYAKTSETNAATSEANAKTSETNAEASETAAATSEANASASEKAAKTSETNAKASETNAATSEANALTDANRAQSYAVGGTGTRNGEDTDNASWYYNEMKDMFVGLNIVFIPKGTISFSELATVKETAVAGYVYNISDDFVTDETFMEGSGMTYIAGTNVYYVIDDEGNGKWDCFGGAASPTATVDEVKEYLGI